MVKVTQELILTFFQFEFQGERWEKVPNALKFLYFFPNKWKMTKMFSNWCSWRGEPALLPGDRYLRGKVCWENMDNLKKPVGKWVSHGVLWGSFWGSFWKWIVTSISHIGSHLSDRKWLHGRFLYSARAMESVPMVRAGSSNRHSRHCA